MERHFFFSFFVCLSITACNNSSEGTPKATTDTIAVVKDNTSAKTDSTPVAAASPFDLTADEIKDDSVFADGSRPTSWANAGIDDPVAFKKFLKRLQVSVANDLKDSVAAAIAFPLRNPELKSRKDFLQKYDVYINDKVRAALKGVKLSQIFRNGQGAMIGDGTVWFSKTKNGYAVTAINN